MSEGLLKFGFGIVGIAAAGVIYMASGPAIQDLKATLAPKATAATAAPPLQPAVSPPPAAPAPPSIPAPQAQLSVPVPQPQPLAAIPPSAPDYFLRAKQATIRILKDPDSAKFADLFASRGSPRIICGLINAKNGYGGYTGMTPFTYYADTDKAVIAQGLSNGETIRALKTWQQECRP